MKPDPIVAEVRAVRDRLAARFNYDIDAIVRHIQRVEAASGRTYVQPPQRDVAAVNAPADRAPGEGRGADEAEGRADGHEADEA